MLFSEFLKQIKSCPAKDMPPLYIFTGPAKQVSELKEKGLRILSHRLTGLELTDHVRSERLKDNQTTGSSESRASNVSNGAEPPRRFDMANFSEPEFWTELYAVPFLNQPRLALLNIADKNDFINKMEKPLSDYLAGRTFFTRLAIFVDKLESVAASLIRLLNTKGWVIECEPVSEERLPGWIASQLGVYGKKISPSAARLLVEKSGGDLARIDETLKKLVLFHRNESVISDESIRDFVDTERDFDINELTNAIVSRQTALALKIADRLLQKGEPVNKILGFLRTGLAYDARRRNDKTLLLSRYNKLLVADMAIKTGRLPEELALQTLVVKLIRAS
ncbi:MAG: DNA polymerase III subunit delta [Planctomycetota bacterium]